MADVSPDSDEFAVELMTQCELKLHLLHEELQGKDLTAIMKEMLEEEVRQNCTILTGGLIYRFCFS